MLTSILSLHFGHDISVDMLESSDFVEVVKRVGDDFLVAEMLVGSWRQRKRGQTGSVICCLLGQNISPFITD